MKQRILGRFARLTKWGVIYVLLFVLGAWLASFASDVSDNKDALAEANRSTTQLAEDLTTQKAVGERLEAQLRALGEKPVVTSPALPNLVTGIQGERGPAPTTSQLLLAFQMYCLDHGGCVGPTGPAGESITGPKGDTVVGPAGESITGPKGDVGEKGDTGAKGSDGRGIVSGPECDADGNLVTHYDQEPLVESHPAPACQPLIDLPGPEPTP